MNLPVSFQKNMQDLFFKLGKEAEYADFLASFDGQPKAALRFNTNKGDLDYLRKFIENKYNLPPLEQVPWTIDAFYLPDGFLAAHTVEYLQGWYYLQEASAMLPAVILNAKPGQIVLDLCAAPGGKSTKLLADMHNQGLLVANEINLDRARVLLRNLEQWGSTNVILTNNSPEELVYKAQSFFDKILVDAPCSGEGMFMRDPKAVLSWESYSTDSCQKLQMEILAEAAKLLKPGGEILYSTCTFNVMENEEVIADFLNNHDDFYLLDAKKRLPAVTDYVSAGLADVDHQDTGLCLRIFPHLAPGEGHFCALLAKTSLTSEVSSVHLNSQDHLNQEIDTKDSIVSRLPVKKVKSNKINKRLRDNKYTNSANCDLSTMQSLALDFLKKHCKPESLVRLNDLWINLTYNERNFLHLLPQISLNTEGLHILKKGVLLGEIKQGKKPRFIPSHALALALDVNDFSATLELDTKRYLAYISGQTLGLDQDEYKRLKEFDYCLLTVNQHSLGFAKIETGSLKNLYPASWVRNLTNDVYRRKESGYEQDDYSK